MFRNCHRKTGSSLFLSGLSPVLRIISLTALASAFVFAQATANPTGEPIPKAYEPVLDIEKGFTDIIRPMLGAGFSYRLDDSIDFSDTNNILLTKDDSKHRAAVLAGFFVPLTKCATEWEHAQKEGMINPSCYTKAKAKFTRRLGVVFNFQFSQGSQSSVDGFMMGLGWLLRPGVVVNGGYTRSLGKELSPGFMRAAVAAMQNNPGEKSFDRFRPLIHPDGSGLKSNEYWDGFPLVYGTNNTQVFPSGNAIIDSYNSSVTFGVSITLDAIVKQAKK